MKKILLSLSLALALISAPVLAAKVTVPSPVAVFDNSTGTLFGIGIPGQSTVTQVQGVQTSGGIAVGADYQSATVPTNGMLIEGAVAIGTTTPNTGVTLDIGSATDSLLLPVGTTGQRPTGVNGMVRYNSTSPASVESYVAGGWKSILGSVSTIAATGSVTLTNGLIINWGPWTSAGSQAAVAVTYNTAFTTATYAVVADCNSASTTAAQTWSDTPANSGINLRAQVGSLACYYIAIGK